MQHAYVLQRFSIRGIVLLRVPLRLCRTLAALSSAHVYPPRADAKISHIDVLRAVLQSTGIIYDE